MSGIKWRWRPLHVAIVRRVIWSVAIAGAAYIIERVAGLHPQAWSNLAWAGGYLLAFVLGGVSRKGAIPAADRHGEPAYEVPPSPEAEVLILVEQGRKIQAIKRYRELNPGVGLKEAKDVIDGLAAQLSTTSP